MKRKNNKIQQKLGKKKEKRKKTKQQLAEQKERNSKYHKHKQ